MTNEKRKCKIETDLNREEVIKMKKAILGSLVLAILHSILFYGQNLGISVMLFTIPLIFFIVNVLKEKSKIKNTKPLLLSIPIILLSITYFIFNNTFFYFWNMVAIIILFVLMIVLSVFEENKIRDIITRFFRVIGKPFEKIEEVIQFIINYIFDGTEREEEKKNHNKNMKKVILGIVISLPILVIIILLLASADTIFAGEVEEITGAIGKIFGAITLKEILARMLLILIITVYSAAFINNLIENEQEENEIKREDTKISFDNIIINTILTIVNFVYVVFCYIQIVNLFMGYTNLSETEYANYARQGFFQLMAVSLINLIIILVTTHNQKESTTRQQNYTKVMNLLLAVFTLIILISSFMRMYLYEQAFGYTFLRLMVYIILITEAILMIPTVMHIFDRKVNLIKPYFIIILTMYVLVNYINIDKIIAKKNVDRYFDTNNIGTEKGIDIDYLKTTGIDGALEVKRLLNADDKRLKIEVNNYLYAQRNKGKDMNMQEFNINRYLVNNKLQGIEYKIE